jgi:hypothetical protein
MKFRPAPLKHHINFAKRHPRVYLRYCLFATKAWMSSEISSLSKPRKIVRILKELFWSGVKAAALGFSLYLVSFLHISESLDNLFLSLKAASQGDIKRVNDALTSYEDYLNQKVDRAGRSLSKEQELFSDVVRNVFPLKWTSGLYTLKPDELARLNAGREVVIAARYSGFSKPPILFPVLKGLNPVFQMSGSATINVNKSQCDYTSCKIRLIWPQPNAPHNQLKSPPQVHWIAAGEYPRDNPDDDNTDAGDSNSNDR